MNSIQNTPSEYATRSRYPTTTPNITTEEKVTNQDTVTTFPNYYKKNTDNTFTRNKHRQMREGKRCTPN
jgi:hypothetical protein